MVEVISLIVAVTIIAFMCVPDFLTLKVGGVYKDRNGDVVRINHLKKIGDFDIYVSDYDVRYYPNGSRVGDVTKRSEFKLVSKIK